MKHERKQGLIIESHCVEDGPQIAALNDMRWLLFALTIASLGCAPQMGIDIDESSADGVVQEFLWPDATMYAVSQIQEPGIIDRLAISLLGHPLGETKRSEAEFKLFLELERIQKELAHYTPIRIELIEEEDVEEYEHYTTLNFNDEQDDFGVWLQSGKATIGIEGDNETRFVTSSTGVLKHEIGHAAAALKHTHVRKDAEEHVMIIEENIRAKNQHNFDPYPGLTSIGPYDYFSIMHYGSYTWAKDSDCPALLKKGAPDTCDEEHLKPYLLPGNVYHYSTWNYTVMSVIYCHDDFTNDELKPTDGRCDTELVQRNLARYDHWKATDGEEVRLPPEQAVCGDGLLDGDEDCDIRASYCTSECKFTSTCVFRGEPCRREQFSL